jgi:phospholipase D1/2
MADVVARETPTDKLFNDDVLSLRQIIDHAGAAYKAFATENVWVGVGQPFSLPRTGNALKAFTRGKRISVISRPLFKPLLTWSTLPDGK